MLVIWNLFFCVSAVCEIIQPALSEFSNSTLKLWDSLHSIATPLLVLLNEEKKAGPVQSFYEITTSWSVLCVSWRSIISNLELRKVLKIYFLLLLSSRPLMLRDTIPNILILTQRLTNSVPPNYEVRKFRIVERLLQESNWVPQNYKPTGLPTSHTDNAEMTIQIRYMQLYTNYHF